MAKPSGQAGGSPEQRDVEDCVLLFDRIIARAYDHAYRAEELDEREVEDLQAALHIAIQLVDRKRRKNTADSIGRVLQWIHEDQELTFAKLARPIEGIRDELNQVLRWEYTDGRRRPIPADRSRRRGVSAPVSGRSSREADKGK